MVNSVTNVDLRSSNATFLWLLTSKYFSAMLFIRCYLAKTISSYFFHKNLQRLYIQAGNKYPDLIAYKGIGKVYDEVVTEVSKS